MLNGLLVAESLRLDTELCVESLSVTRVTRRDVSSSAAAVAYGESAGVPERQLDWND
jgi:hypothetical protein